MNTWNVQKSGGNVFRDHFAPNPYDESLSGFRFPLDKKEQESLGFYYADKLERKTGAMKSIRDIPESSADLSDGVKEDLLKTVFWDEDFERPFKIGKKDIEISQKLKIPLLYQYYISRMQENFSWMPFDGELRETTCAASGQKIKTSWPAEYDGRILSEEAYLKMIA